MGSDVLYLNVQIVRFVDDHFPGFVACEFRDSAGRRHTMIDKVPVFTVEVLDADSQYPRPGTVACTPLRTWTDGLGREVVAISSEKPWSLESVEGLSEFVVLRSQVSLLPPVA